MKTLSTILIISTLLLNGCARKNINQNSTQPAAPTQIKINNNSSPTTNSNKGVNWASYATQAGATYYFTDLYIPSKCWLIKDNSIIEVISINEIDNNTVIDFSNIERVESSNTTVFNNVSIFDKSGMSISIMLNRKDSEELIELIK